MPVKYSVIASAVKGEPCAMSAVMRHYSRYIDVLATRELIDDDGFARPYIDDAMKREIEAHLADRVMRFRAT